MINRWINYVKKNGIRKALNRFLPELKRLWTLFWLSFAGLSFLGRIAARFAMWFAPPHKARTILAEMSSKGFIAPSVIIYHSDLQLGTNVLIDDRVIIYQAKDGGQVKIGNYVRILRDAIIETGLGGSLQIGNKTWIHPRCQINAYNASIYIGCDVQVAPGCAFYSYDHGFEPDERIVTQPLQTKGNIVVGDSAWLGVGVIVLSGVRIGRDAVIGAGSVVTHDIPDGAIAIGMPARTVKMRSDITTERNEVKLK